MEKMAGCEIYFLVSLVFIDTFIVCAEIGEQKN